MINKLCDHIITKKFFENALFYIIGISLPFEYTSPLSLSRYIDRALCIQSANVCGDDKSLDVTNELVITSGSVYTQPIFYLEKINWSSRTISFFVESEKNHMKRTRAL